MSPNPQNIPPFKSGEPIKASSLEGLRAGVQRRISGFIGRKSSYSEAGAQSTQTVQERIEVLNNTGSDIPAFSLFAIKKSDTINYPWGPPVRTEAFKSEVGFNYVTNYDYEIANTVAYQCFSVGHLPVLIRYKDTDGIPKMGHPIGPLEEGSVSIKRCGYVVIAEPDIENKRVWIVKSNDQIVRTTLVADLEPNCRGECTVISAPDCGQPYGAGVTFADPNVVSGGTFVLREVLNLTDRTLLAGSINFAEPTLGLGYVMCTPCKGITEWLATLTADLCPDTETGAAIIDERIGNCNTDYDVNDAVSFENLFGLSAKADMRVLLGHHEDEQGNTILFAKQLQHACKNIVVPVGSCDTNDPQNPTPNFGKFIKYDACKIQGHILLQTSQMFCGDESWTDQIQLYEHAVLANATLGPSEQDTCNYTLQGQVDTFCAFTEQDPDVPLLPLGSTRFNTTTMWDQLQLEYDPGTITSGSEVEECFSPVLKLNGRQRQVLVCDDCDSLDPEQPNGPGYQCTGWALVEWVENDEVWAFYPGYSNGNCSCENCEIVMPVDPPVFGESIYRIVDCTCIDPENDFTCCEDTDPPTTPVECPLENITAIPLTLSTAYYRKTVGTDSQGRKCINLIPIGFVTFGDCAEGDPEELICGNPCPEEGS